MRQMPVEKLGPLLLAAWGEPDPYSLLLWLLTQREHPTCQRIQHVRAGAAEDAGASWDDDGRTDTNLSGCGGLHPLQQCRQMLLLAAAEEVERRTDAGQRVNQRAAGRAGPDECLIGRAFHQRRPAEIASQLPRIAEMRTEPGTDWIDVSERSVVVRLEQLDDRGLLRLILLPRDVRSHRNFVLQLPELRLVHAGRIRELFRLLFCCLDCAAVCGCGVVVEALEHDLRVRQVHQRHAGQR